MKTLDIDIDGIKKFSLLDQSKKLFQSRLYDTFFTTEYGKLEAVRSERYGNPFSIIIVNIESFRDKSKPSKEVLFEFFKKFVTTILEVVRNCDVVGMVEDRRIIIILPQTDYFGSLIAIRKLSKGLEHLANKGEPDTSIIYSHATFPKDANGYSELMQVAIRRISDQRESMWQMMDLNNKLFWEIVETVADASQNDETYVNFDLGESERYPDTFVDKLNEMIIEDIARTPKKRGILYIGIKNSIANHPLRKHINTLGTTATKIFIVSEGKEVKMEIKNATFITLTDSRLKDYFFTFYLNEDSAYAIICKESWGETHTCFHTSDPYLVEGLITKFQRDYYLQEQL